MQALHSSIHNTYNWRNRERLGVKLTEKKLVDVQIATAGEIFFKEIYSNFFRVKGLIEPLFGATHAKSSPIVLLMVLRIDCGNYNNNIIIILLIILC